MSKTISQLRVFSGVNICSGYAVLLCNQLELNESMIQIRQADDRGHVDNGWLHTNHTFVFAAYPGRRECASSNAAHHERTSRTK